MYCITPPNIGTLREIYFLRAIHGITSIAAPKSGDFLIDDQYTIEIGGKDKSFSQIKKATNAYLACDEMEIGLKYKIPLWLWGFLK